MTLKFRHSDGTGNFLLSSVHTIRIRTNMVGIKTSNCKLWNLISFETESEGHTICCLQLSSVSFLLREDLLIRNESMNPKIELNFDFKDTISYLLLIKKLCAGHELTSISS